MVDVCDEYERYLAQYKKFLRAYSQRQMARVRPVVISRRETMRLRLLVWLGRLASWVLGCMLKAIEQATDAMVAAFTR